MKLTCYVDAFGDLLTYDTAERLRTATAGERQESREELPTGAFSADVSDRTVRRQAPMLIDRMKRLERAP